MLLGAALGIYVAETLDVPTKRDVVLSAVVLISVLVGAAIAQER